MRKFKCINKHCQHIASFSLPNEADHHPICPCCGSIMIDFEKVIMDDIYARMYKNIEAYGIESTLKMIDNIFSNAKTRCAYRKILHETIAKFNLQ